MNRENKKLNVKAIGMATAITVQSIVPVAPSQLFRVSAYNELGSAVEDNLMKSIEEASVEKTLNVEEVLAEEVIKVENYSDENVKEAVEIDISKEETLTLTTHEIGYSLQVVEKEEVQNTSFFFAYEEEIENYLAISELFQDSHIAEAVAQALNITTSIRISKEQLLSLEILSINEPIRTLSGVQYLENLIVLSVGNEEDYYWEIDLEPLRNLKNLQSLEFKSSVYISDISALADLPNLSSVRISEGSIRDLRPLAHVMQNSNSSTPIIITNQDINLPLVHTGVPFPIEVFGPLGEFPEINASEYFTFENGIITWMEKENSSSSSHWSVWFEINVPGLVQFTGRIHQTVSPAPSEDDWEIEGEVLGEIQELFPDVALAQGVADRLTYLRYEGYFYKYSLESQITQGELDRITLLWPAYVNGLDGIERLQNLEILRLPMQRSTLSDISPLSSLINLRELLIGYGMGGFGFNGAPTDDEMDEDSLRMHENWNQSGATLIEDISPLKYLTNLEYLYLFGSYVEDISPLSNLYNLRNLNLMMNQIKDASPLSNLENLETLTLDFNRIESLDLNSPNLKQISAIVNKLSDVEWARELHRLEYLNIDFNSVMDLRPLSTLENLEFRGRNQRVYLAEAQINEEFYLALYVANNETLALSSSSEFSFEQNSLVWSSVGDNRLTWRAGQMSDYNDESNTWAQNVPTFSGTIHQHVVESPSEDWIIEGNVLGTINEIFPDTALAQVIAQQLTTLRHNGYFYTYTPTSPITQSELDRITSLYSVPMIDVVRDEEGNPIRDESGEYIWIYTSGEIADLNGLEFLVNLTNLDLAGNQIVDLSPIENLTNLQYLSLGVSARSGGAVGYNYSPLGNSVSDISPLSNLHNLEVLDLSNNFVNDLSALKNLTNLTRLILHNNQITNVEALSGLTNLQFLILGYNGISDLNAINIQSLGELTTYLALDGNDIVDVAPLASLTSLESITLTRNRISDIRPLGELSQTVIIQAPYQRIYFDNITLGEVTFLNIFGFEGETPELVETDDFTLGRNPQEIIWTSLGANTLEWDLTTIPDGDLYGIKFFSGTIHQTVTEPVNEEITTIITALQNLVNEIQALFTTNALIPTDYTEESWARFLSALYHAETILSKYLEANPSPVAFRALLLSLNDELAPTLEEVQQAYAELREAFEGLVEVETEPIPEPKPEPTPEPKPAPQPKPTPEPKPEPQPEPTQPPATRPTTPNRPSTPNRPTPQRPTAPSGNRRPERERLPNTGADASMMTPLAGAGLLGLATMVKRFKRK